MSSVQSFSGLWAYWLIIALMMVGLYIVIARDNLIKKVMGLNIFQAAAILFYVTMAKVTGGTAPIVPHDPAHPGGHAEHEILYSNPLPHVLMLTAIVVGVATTALALALAVRIHGDYGTAEEDEALAYDMDHG